MKRFPRAAWGLVLAAFAGGCGHDPAPIASSTAEPAATDECECCRAQAKSAQAKSSPAATPNTEGLLRSPWLEPDARSESLTTLRVTDQDGQALDLSEFRGRPLALTFLYTRCTNPNRCPLVATQMGRLQKLVEAEG